MNSRWHDAHRMPKNAKLEERVAWHLAHQKACACRPIPASVAEAIAAKHGVSAKTARRARPSS